MSTRTMRTVLAGLALGIAGCSTAALQPGDVQRGWTRTFRELGINPIYPPREDVQVGDVYLRRGHPADRRLVETRGPVPLDVLVAHLDVRDLLTDHYGRRSAFASTVGDAAHRIPRDASNTFANVDLSAMRQVAFPEFSTATVRGSDLSAFIPIEALTLALGVATENFSAVDLKVSSGESYGLPALTVLREIATAGADGWRLRSDRGLTPTVIGAMLAGQREWARIAEGVGDEGRRTLAEGENVFLDVITEVYYARTIDFAVRAESQFGTRAEIETIDAVARRMIQTENQDPITPVQPSSFARADVLNGRLAEATSGRSIGGDLEYTSVSESLITMRRTFERPIAVGFRGVTLAIDPKTAQIIGTTASSAEATAGREDLQYAALARITGERLNLTNVKFQISARTVRGRPGLNAILPTADGLSAAFNESREAIIIEAQKQMGEDFFTAHVLEAFRDGPWTVSLGGGRAPSGR